MSIQMLLRREVVVLCRGSVSTSCRHLSTIESKRTFTQQDVDTFARISGDTNPIHVDTSDTNKYGKPIVHGTLMLGHLSGMIAQAAAGSLLLHMNIKFDHYLHVDQEMEITATATQLKKTVLHMDILGTSQAKQLFKGDIQVGLPKSAVRKIRANYPELLNPG